jgi:hypothetical protein
MAERQVTLKWGEIPPWMERVAERAHLSDGGWWYGDEDAYLPIDAPDSQALYAKKEPAPTCASCAHFDGDAEFCRARSHWDPSVVGRAVVVHVSATSPACPEYEENQ